jgi:hypothetical protein
VWDGEKLSLPASGISGLRNLRSIIGRASVGGDGLIECHDCSTDHKQSRQEKEHASRFGPEAPHIHFNFAATVFGSRSGKSGCYERIQISSPSSPPSASA